MQHKHTSKAGESSCGTWQVAGGNEETKEITVESMKVALLTIV